MDDMKPDRRTLEEAKRFASSQEAQRLRALLQQSNAQGLKSAMELAGKGDLNGAKTAIEQYLSTPEAKELLEQLRKNP